MHAPLEFAVRRIRALAGSPTDTASDGDLLARFVATRDDAAFAALVERHGPAVLGVCQRILRDLHSADDAFQATFLVLARRAATVRNSASVGAWLHGVAVRIASKLKVQLLRLPRTGTIPERPTVGDDLSWREVRRILDEEVARLPERLRHPILLCYFEGRTRDEAANLLGCKITTLRGRLEDARGRLQTRLVRRGIDLSAALLAISAMGNPCSIAATMPPISSILRMYAIASRSIRLVRASTK